MSGLVQNTVLSNKLGAYGAQSMKLNSEKGFRGAKDISFKEPRYHSLIFALKLVKTVKFQHSRPSSRYSRVSVWPLGSAVVLVVCCRAVSSCLWAILISSVIGPFITEPNQLLSLVVSSKHCIKSVKHYRIFV